MKFMNIVAFFEGRDTLGIDGERGEEAIDRLRASELRYGRIRRRKNGDLRVETPRGDSEKARLLLGDRGINTYYIRRRGFPELVHRYRRRPGIAVGALLLAAVLWLSTQFIWRMEVYGNDTLTAESILAELDSLGCSVGSYIPGIDFYSLCTAYLARSEDVSWISVNILGTTAEVRVLERMKKETDGINGPANVIAACDGVVEYVNSAEGEAVVTDGDTIVKGQLLISGVVEDKNDHSNRYVRAGGSVIARTFHVLTVQIPLEYENRVYTGHTEENIELGVFGRRFTAKRPSLSGGREYEEESTAEDVCIFGDIILPVIIYRTTYYPYVTEIAERTPEAAALLADAEMAALISRELAEAEILQRKTSASVTEDENGVRCYTLTCEMRCMEDIAVAVPLTVSE